MAVRFSFDESFSVGEEEDQKQMWKDYGQRKKDCLAIMLTGKRGRRSIIFWGLKRRIPSKAAGGERGGFKRSKGDTAIIYKCAFNKREKKNNTNVALKKQNKGRGERERAGMCWGGGKRTLQNTD